MKKKYILIVNMIAIMERLMDGKRVEGALYIDQITGQLTFKGYNRQAPQRESDRLVKKLPWGWVRESAARIKVFGSFPKDYGTAAMMGLMDEHSRDSKNAMIERELMEFC